MTTHDWLTVPPGTACPYDPDYIFVSQDGSSIEEWARCMEASQHVMCCTVGELAEQARAGDDWGHPVRCTLVYADVDGSASQKQAMVTRGDRMPIDAYERSERERKVISGLIKAYLHQGRISLVRGYYTRADAGEGDDDDDDQQDDAEENGKEKKDDTENGNEQDQEDDDGKDQHENEKDQKDDDPNRLLTEKDLVPVMRRHPSWYHSLPEDVIDYIIGLETDADQRTALNFLSGEMFHSEPRPTMLLIALYDDKQAPYFDAGSGYALAYSFVEGVFIVKRYESASLEGHFPLHDPDPWFRRSTPNTGRGELKLTPLDLAQRIVDHADTVDETDPQDGFNCVNYLLLGIFLAQHRRAFNAAAHRREDPTRFTLDRSLQKDLKAKLEILYAEVDKPLPPPQQMGEGTARTIRVTFPRVFKVKKPDDEDGDEQTDNEKNKNKIDVDEKNENKQMSKNEAKTELKRLYLSARAEWDLLRGTFRQAAWDAQQSGLIVEAKTVVRTWEAVHTVLGRLVDRPVMEGCGGGCLGG